MNLIHDLEETLDSVFGGRASVVTLREPGASDLAVVLADRLPGLVAEAAELLGALPEVASIRRSGQRLLLKIEDECIDEVGRALVASKERAMGVDALLAGRRYIVEFCDPNATKALHLGHLRNIALGHGLASALETAGAQVERQSQISDYGQQVGEAMAGYLCFGDQSTPASAGKKGDHFIGELYARYVQANSSKDPEVAAHDLPVAREIFERGDLATELLSRWKAGDPEVVVLWETVLDWTLSAQEETLRRLGVRFDRPLLESSYLPFVPEFIEAALRAGVVKYAASGALIHETGRDEYPAFPLTRPDGFPTLNLRALTIWDRLIQTLDEAVVIHVCGDEWKEHTRCVADILDRMHPEEPPIPAHDLVHGMVLTDGGAMSSSGGKALLIDDLLDSLVDSPEVRALEAGDGRGVPAEQLARLMALGYCLNVPTSKPLLADRAAVTESRGAGVRFARAWAKACGSDGRCPKPEDPSDPDYRFAVVQAQEYRRVLQKSVAELDPFPLVRFLGRLCDWYIQLPPDSGSTPVLKTLFEVGFGSIGVLKPALAKAGAVARSARQGGDVRDLPIEAALDLSTCVNRYGPPPRVQSALGKLDIRDLRAHPFGVEQEFLRAYARYLGVDASRLVAGRGISEFIRILSWILGKESVAVVAPDYTDTVASFPQHIALPNGAVTDTPELRLERLLRGMASKPYVMLSNPNNPTGIYIDSGDLIEACRQYPHTTLIVDEAFIEFVAAGRCNSMVHAGVDNLVVLRSPNKLFGIAGVRTGALYTRDLRLRQQVEGMTLNWPLSYVDVRIACAAIEELEWATTTRERLLATIGEMESLLSSRFPSMITEAPVHYRFIPTQNPAELEQDFLRRGVVVRAFSANEPGRLAGVRIVAPTAEELASSEAFPPPQPPVDDISTEGQHRGDQDQEGLPVGPASFPP